MPRPVFHVGDPSLDFHCPTATRPQFRFDTMSGRYVVLSFLGSSQLAPTKDAVSLIAGPLRARLDDDTLCYFGVTIDPADEETLRPQLPGIRFFHDFDQNVSVLYGALEEAAPLDTALGQYKPFTMVLDPMLRVLAVIPLEEADAHNATLGRVLQSLPPIDDHAQVPLTAPVLIVPRVFEPAFCRMLIDRYNTFGGIESGSMTERDGKTVGKIDHSFKRRMDHEILDRDVQEAMRYRILRRLLPQIKKSFQFDATRIERYIVACYDANSGGFFKPHRDNTTKGTAHRKFAVTINLNAEEYEGGDLRFPEFGSKTYRAPTGGAAVFSCSLLHEATAVTRGTRYATLPFLYDEAGAKLRAENESFVSGETINLNPQG